MTKLEFLKQSIIINQKTNCHETTLRLNKKGYGQVYYQKRTWMTHRLLFFLEKGIQDKNLLVCHTCDNRKCINIEHLYLGTAQDNANDREKRCTTVVKHKTHCKNGHERNLTNSHTKPNGIKECKICGRAASNRYNAKKRK